MTACQQPTCNYSYSFDTFTYCLLLMHLTTIKYLVQE